MAGATLTLVDQGNVVPAGAFSAGMAGEIAVTYRVPYVVAAWPALRTSTVRH